MCPVGNRRDANQSIIRARREAWTGSNTLPRLSGLERNSTIAQKESPRIMSNRYISDKFTMYSMVIGTGNNLLTHWQEKSWRHCDKYLLVTSQCKEGLREALDYRKYSPGKKSSRYDEKVPQRVPEWPKPLKVQMKSQTFHSLNLISICSFLSTFKLAWDSNAVTKLPTFGFYIFKRLASGTLNAASNSNSKSHGH